MDDELAWVVSKIKQFLGGGLVPEEIVVIALDDRNARRYLSRTAEGLAAMEISSNNIIADPYNEPPFAIPGKITLSTVYRAKGNEASVVSAIGIDAVARNTRDGRNKIFTAFTRSKAWLRVSGMGDAASKVFSEIDRAMARPRNAVYDA